MSYYNNPIINNKELYDFYYKYKPIIMGSRTTNDAIHIIDNLKITQQRKNILLNLLNGINFPKILDNKEFIETFKEIDNLTYREDAYEYINKIMRKTCDLAQIKCLTRKANIKPLKPQYILLKDIYKQIKTSIDKSCPYCGHTCRGTEKSGYMICGYGENGYDWEGCGHDWCFKCDKLLCKSWDMDQLFIQENRLHDNECCKKQARDKNKNYLQDYCQCNNAYVKRNVSLIR